MKISSGANKHVKISSGEDEHVAWRFCLVRIDTSITCQFRGFKSELTDHRRATNTEHVYDDVVVFVVVVVAAGTPVVVAAFAVVDG